MLKAYVQVRLWRDRVMGRVKSVLSGEQGATVSEYALVLALVTVAVITVLGNLGTALSDKIEGVTQAINSGTTP